MRQASQRKAEPISVRQVAAKSQAATSILQDGRAAARAWVQTVDARRRQMAAWSFVSAAVKAYAAAVGETLGRHPNVSPLTLALSYALDQRTLNLAQSVGRAASALPMERAFYQVSSLYASLLPDDLRSAWGAYYTPPALAGRLMEMAAEAGIDWKTARVLDPACGGGAFLVPVALKMREALGRISGRKLLEHFSTHLRGLEIDPFAAWLTQAWLEIVFAREAATARINFPAVVSICDSLEQNPSGKLFDLVIGNPPYGRRTLSKPQREVYKRSLYGHANLYGLFTDLALRWTRLGGVVAYVTPTSFLAGEYFKALRGLLAAEAPPLAVDFISSRKGVFEDVLQEAMLATYGVGARIASTAVHHLATTSSGSIALTNAGSLKMPAGPTDPWLAPREPAQQAMVDRLAGMPTRLKDWGYRISTGPLVWNRHKPQLAATRSKGCFPLIWAEAVTADGQFVFRANKKNHQPFFRIEDGDDWLKVTTPCVLLQRTTAKEQSRRLIAAELPPAFLNAHGAVVVENHLNMIKPMTERPPVSPAIVAAVLNAQIVDAAFRCISGSVAVSAFELEALPLPSVEQAASLSRFLSHKDAATAVERELSSFYKASIDD